jgi:hypothetical protein
MVENFIGVWENAYSPEYCKRVIKFFEDTDALGGASSRKQFEGVDSIVKNDDTIFIDEHNIPLVHTRELLTEFYAPFWTQYYEEYANEYSILKGSGKHNSYGGRIQRTRIGGGYHVWHYESSAREVSNRVCAWMLYLNDVEEGGETEFLYQHKRIKPKQGTFLLWPAGYTHTHRGNPPLSNDKYIITGWLEF